MRSLHLQGSAAARPQRRRSGPVPVISRMGPAIPPARNRSCQPRDILSPKGLLPGRRRQDRMGEAAQDRHANACSAVKQPREHDGIDCPNEALGGGRRDAEQGGGHKCVEDCGSIHAGILAQKSSSRTRQQQARTCRIG